MGAPILEAVNLTKAFGELVANDDISAAFADDELCAIIGPNGAGKTTFFNLLSGTLQPTSGSVRFKGEDITHSGPEEIAMRGLTRSFQITSIFDEISVFENVRVAVQSKFVTYDFWHDADALDEVVDQTEAILRRVGLEEYRDTLAANLSHGDQRTLDIAVALGADPDMLLLDEPSSGMGAEETREVITLVERLADEFPILIVEHDMQVVREVSDRIIVLHNGSVIADGNPAEVREDEHVQRVYLGEETL